MQNGDSATTLRATYGPGLFARALRGDAVAPLASVVRLDPDEVEARMSRLLASACAVAASKCEGRPSTYFPSIDKVFLDGPNSGLATFVLFWTLSYNCCHLF